MPGIASLDVTYVFITLLFFGLFFLLLIGGAFFMFTIYRYRGREERSIDSVLLQLSVPLGKSLVLPVLEVWFVG